MMADSPYFLQLQGQYAKCEESINPSFNIKKLIVESQSIVIKYIN